MLHVDVAGLAGQGAPGPENWGQLLDLLEQGDGTERQVVTAVRFDGVAVPTFRDPSALGRTLQAVGPIEVETTTVNALLHESARAAHESIAPLKKAIHRIARSLRTRTGRAGNCDVPGVTAVLQTLTQVTAMLAGACQNADARRREFDRLVGRLCQIVDHVIERQAVEDRAGVADVLDRELAPALDEWSVILRQAWTV